MFPDGPTLVVFAIAAFVLLITPGPAVFYIVARSIDQGRIAGIVSTLGVGAGALVQVGAAALGVSAVLLSSALAFDILKYLGAAYLIYLGVRKFLVRDELEQSRVLAPRTLARIFYDGVVVNVLNPKTALFFFAFLPQFVDIKPPCLARATLPCRFSVYRPRFSGSAIRFAQEMIAG
jgi:threonine/homoserine/homoserine lactone efflux protein